MGFCSVFSSDYYPNLPLWFQQELAPPFTFTHGRFHASMKNYNSWLEEYHEHLRRAASELGHPIRGIFFHECEGVTKLVATSETIQLVSMAPTHDESDHSEHSDHCRGCDKIQSPREVPVLVHVPASAEQMESVLEGNAKLIGDLSLLMDAVTGNRKDVRTLTDTVERLRKKNLRVMRRGRLYQR